MRAGAFLGSGGLNNKLDNKNASKKDNLGMLLGLNKKDDQ